jgi:tRNA pseudouridine55 synthase
MEGVLVVDKPAGMTSHDVVDTVRRRLGTRKVGHAGTLDPDATGLLVVGVGRATRLLSYSQAVPKRYLARVALGATTTTQDAAGDVIERRPANVARADVERALSGFVGEIEQVPPMVSAVKVAGERLYARARRGEDVERPPRRVTVHRIDVVGWQDGDQPRVELDVVCSTGTFVRTIAHDLGQSLGCGAHLAALRRIEAGGFTERDAVGLDEVSPERLRPLVDAVGDLPRMEVDEPSARLVRYGRSLHGVGAGDAPLVAIIRGGHLLGVYARRGDSLVPERVIRS